MKRFLKKASIYILLMVLVAGIIFSLNYYYGKKISKDVEAEISQIAKNNNYQLRFLEVETNPLLQKMKIQNLNLTKADQFNLIVNQGEIKLSWQQILNYFRQGKFQLDKNFESIIKQVNYSNLKDNYQLNFNEVEIKYQGKLPEEKITQANSKSDLSFLFEEDHKIDFQAAELKYDFPYYRSYGLNSENWNRLSTFNNFNMKANYSAANQRLKVEEFNLRGELLKIIFKLDSKLNYQAENEKILVEEFKSDYDFLLTGENLEFEANSFFKDLNFKQFDFNGSLDLAKEENRFKANQLNFNLKLSQFKLLLAKKLSQDLNQNTFGILAADNNFEISINEFSYDQKYSYPNGSSSSSLKSSLIEAELEAEYNYSEETPYISNAILKYKLQNARAEQLNSFLQLVLGQSLKKDEAGYYKLEIWGDLDDLNFEGS